MMNHLAKLEALGQRRLELEADLDRLRPELVKLIRTVAADGVRQVEIVKATGYTREMIRRIVKGDPA